jgi:hypothetical protein
MAVALGFVVWLATKGDGNAATTTAAPAAATSPSTAATAAPTATPVGPIALSSAALRALVGSLGQPVYWVGPQPGRRYELKRTTNGSVFLRYLPKGVKAGDGHPFRTVGTYPVERAYADTQSVAREPGAVSRRLKGGWLAVYRPTRPTNIYLARPGFAYQLEVFDPSPAQARRLVESGALRQIR